MNQSNPASETEPQSLGYKAPFGWGHTNRLSGPALWVSQTKALVLDAYRELNSKKLFWIVLVLSGLFSVVIGAVGFDESGVSIFGKQLMAQPSTAFYSAEEFYIQLLFLPFGVGFWITWAATILALISTAGIIPDLITGGSVDLYLSKPLGRVRLFLTKYILGLLFVALQISFFCLCCFIVIGLRADVWAWSIFIVIPVVTAFYSFLFCVTALVGLWTGSTLAALLVTLLLWLGLFVINLADSALLGFQTLFETQVQGQTASIEQTEQTLEQRRASNPNLSPIILRSYENVLVTKRESLQNSQDNLDQLNFWYDLVLAVKAPLPKTSESIDILTRWLNESESLAPTKMADVSQPLVISEDERAAMLALASEDANVDDTVNGAIVEAGDQANDQGEAGSDEEQRVRRRQRRENDIGRAMSNDAVQNNIRAKYLGRGPAWVFGTSFAFEAVILGLAVWSFSRRDF